MKVKSIHGDFRVSPASATDEPINVGPADLILFCVKTYHTDDAAQAIRPAVGRHTVVLSLQNGIDAADRIGKVVGAEHVIGGAAWLSSTVEAPGVIRQISQFRWTVFGEMGGGRSQRIQSVFEALNSTDVTVEISDNIQKVLWTRFVFISAVSSIGSLARLSIGDYHTVPATRELLTGIMRELEALAHAQDIRLDPDVVQKTLEFLDKAAPHIKPSMQLDVEAGNRTELESMVGVIGRKGRELGIATAVADFVYGSLLPVELKARSN